MTGVSPTSQPSLEDPIPLTRVYANVHITAIACMHVDKVQRVVTCLGRLQLAATLGARVTKLHLALEQLCAGAADPGHHRLLYPPLLQGGNLDHAEIVPHHAFGALIRRQHRCAVSADHRHDSAHQRVLILSSKLSQHHDQLDLWDVLVAQAVVRQSGSREDITADGDPCAAEKDSTQVYLHELHRHIRRKCWLIKQHREATCRPS